jgi:hypothetical protein
MIVNNELERSRRKWSWLNLRHCPGIYLEGVRRNFSQDGWCHSQNFNKAPAKYKSEVFPLELIVRSKKQTSSTTVFIMEKPTMPKEG